MVQELCRQSKFDFEPDLVPCHIVYYVTLYPEPRDDVSGHILTLGYSKVPLNDATRWLSQGQWDDDSVTLKQDAIISGQLILHVQILPGHLGIF